MDQVITAVVAVIGVPLVLLGYIVLGERVIERLPDTIQTWIRPYFWALPAIGFATIFISHDLSIAAELADRMLTMYAGRIVERATVEDLFYRPRHPYSVGLMRAVPRVSGALGSVVSIPGSPPDLIRLPRGCSYYPRCPFHVEQCLEQDPPLIPVDTRDHEAACIRWEAVAAALGSDAEAPVAEKLA